MLSARDGNTLRVKIVEKGRYTSYVLGKRSDSSNSRVMVRQDGEDTGRLLFNPRKHTVEFPNFPHRRVKKRCGYYHLQPGDVAVVSIKEKKRNQQRPATNGAGKIYVVFDATSR